MSAATSIAVPRERPILFSAPMVRAIVAGAKTQTRRIVKLTSEIARLGGDLSRAWPDLLWGVTPGLHVPCADETVQRLRNPWGWPEPSRLWVKETFAWSVRDPESHEELGEPENYDPVYRATHEGVGVWERYEDGKPAGKTAPKWRPSVFMPRWASRITLEVTGVRVERLNEISDADARAEGVDPTSAPCVHPWPCARCEDVGCRGPAHRAFAALWDSINGERAPWASNPWCWRIEFRRLT